MPRRGSTWQNWGRNQQASPALLARPVDDAEVAKLIGLASDQGHTVRPVGSSHSFTALAVTEGILMDLSSMNEIISVDRVNHRITVGAGMTLNDLNRKLWDLGMSLPNLGDIDVQTVAGATATGTHGTGASYQCISTAIVGAKVVLADGSVVTCSTTERPDLLGALRVSLGALGIITEITLQCVPAFHLHAVETTHRIDDVLERFDEAAAGNEHVEFYWFPYTDLAQLKVNNRSSEAPKSRGRVSHFITNEVLANGGFDLVNRYGRRKPEAVTSLIEKVIKPGERIEFIEPSHKVFCSARRVRFVEMEYAIPRAQLHDVFAEVRAVFPTLDRHVGFPIEVRVLGADDVPLSTSSGRDSAYIACHVYQGTPHEEYFSKVEAIMARHDGRPHWGKMNTRTAAELAPLYPRWNEFQKLLHKVDPDRVFANAYTTPRPPQPLRPTGHPSSTEPSTPRTRSAKPS